MARQFEDIPEATSSPSASPMEPRAIIGFFADDADLMDVVCELAMQGRERNCWRQACG